MATPALEPLLAQLAPHGFCYAWSDGLVWSHVIADGAIALAYFSIPVSLGLMWRRRPDLPSHWLLGLFAAFIVACGATHAMEIWNVWHADYWLAAGVKAFTAVASLTTAFLLARRTPALLTTPSPRLLAQLNAQLETAVGARTRELEASNAQLRERERSYRFLADIMPGLVWTARPDGETDYCSRPWFYQSGRTTDDAARDGWLAAVHLADRERCEREWRAAVARQRDFATEYRFVAADGTWRWHLVRAVAQHDEHGTLLRWVATSTDIHEQKAAAEELERRVALRTEQLAIAERTQRELAASLQRLTSEQRAILHGAAHMIGTCDRAGLFRMWNRAAEQALGWSSDEVIGRATPKLILVPEEVAAAAAALAREIGRDISPEQFLFEAVARREPFEWECHFVRRDGARFPVWLSVTALRDPAGTITGLVGNAIDLTARDQAAAELRRSEQRLRQAQRAARTGCWQFSVAKRDDEEWWSAEMYRLFGLGDPAEKITNARFYGFVHPDDRARVRRVVDTAIAQRSHFVHDYRIVRVDGSERHLHEEAEPVFDESGKLVAFFGTTQDITERKRLEQSLAQARDTALELSRHKSEFIANVSHELRTPMNGIIGLSGLLLETPLTPEQRDMARLVQSSAENLLALINDLLDFSKIEARKVRLEIGELDLRAMVNETLALLAPRAKEKQLALACEFDPQLALPLRGDSGRVRQVLINLVANAIKFTAQGRVSVEVRKVGGTEPRVRVRVAVHDTGPGISAEAQARLFQPFSQLDATVISATGTGLGLAISHQLVTLMGGEIGCRSEVGRGSTFWFELELATNGHPAPAELAPLPRRLRVLVIDHVQERRETLRTQLVRLGVEVESETDGRSGLARLRERAALGTRFDVVLIDWQLSGVTGLQLAIEIRADPVLAATPLVVITNSAAVEDPATVSAVGFEAFLTSPVREAQLHRCLSRLAALPVQNPADDAARAAAAEPQLRLLLAEDNPASQLVAQMLLTKMGHKVDVVSNGALALERLATGSYDAVLMDCQMPVLDGYETTRRIRASAPPLNARIPIIALTAYAMPDDRRKCLAAGMDDYVTKPVRAHELRAALLRCGVLERNVAAEASARSALPAPAETSTESAPDKNAPENLRALPGSE